MHAANKKSPEDYDGPRESSDIVAHVKIVAEKNLPPPEVLELVSPAVWKEQCEV